MIKLMASIFFILSHATMSLLATDQDKDMTNTNGRSRKVARSNAGLLQKNKL